MDTYLHVIEYIASGDQRGGVRSHFNNAHLEEFLKEEKSDEISKLRVVSQIQHGGPIGPFGRVILPLTSVKFSYSW